MKTAGLGPSARVLAFVALCAACGAIVIAYSQATSTDPVRTAWAGVTPANAPAATPITRLNARAAAHGAAVNGPPTARAPESRRPRTTAPDSPGRAHTVEPVRSLQRRFVLFRSTALDQSYLKLSTVPVERIESARTATELRCERVHYAAGTGICLWANRGMFTTYGATFLDGELRPTRTISLAGAPSRVRVSPDGRAAAITVFVSGHSYASANFSTLTAIFDPRTGDVRVPDLEKFTVIRDGKRFQAIDFNFWGVTFASDGNRFYATLASGGRTYLVEGDMSAQTFKVVRADVECPSLSPDNTRIAFKKRSGGLLRAVSWRLTVLDLSTLDEWPLAETRSVDDQAEWLDDANVLYGLPDEHSPAMTNTWRVSSDGRGAPRMFLSQAHSAVVALDARPGTF